MIVFNHINEGATAKLSGVFKDENGVRLGTADMTTLTATLYDKVTGTILNSRSKQNVINKNGGQLDVLGNFSLELSGVDNTLVDTGVVGSELHVLLLEFSYRSGTMFGKQEMGIPVKNLLKVT